MPGRFEPELLRRLSEQIDRLRHETDELAARHAAWLEAVPAEHRGSAANLVHYLAVRDHDLRPLQIELARFGLSSLGRLEGNTRHTLDAVSLALSMMAGRPLQPLRAHGADGLDPVSARELLARRTADLLGTPCDGRDVRIVVTMPTEAATRPALVRDLVAAGMDVMRINLCHDGEAQWSRMVANLRAAEREVGRRCRVLADLGGPKLRTGAVREGVKVARVRPQRDEVGRTTAPARVLLYAGDPPASAAADVCPLPVSPRILAEAQAGDVVELRDARDRRRTLHLVEPAEDGAWHAVAHRSCYVVPGAPLTLRRGDERLAAGAVGDLPAMPGHLRLRIGDLLCVTPAAVVGTALEQTDAAGAGAVVSCTLPDVLAHARPGERMLFDDGRIGGVVERRSGDDVIVRITSAAPGGSKLRADKGLNLPDSDLPFSSLTDADRSQLDWVAQHADMVGLSFVRQPEHVLELIAELAARGAEHVGTVLKIETARGFERLPQLLLAALRSPPVGVMIARGDLAVEVGFARLAEVQEEILWLCEAAHVPVIWATQVLEGMATSGVPSRAEVTDAAMAGRAEAVMLNKGPHAVEAVHFLSGVLQRMQTHQSKKRNLLRRLRVAAW